ncbi:MULTISPECIES: ABC transporter permease [unclassified Agrococcus]|uniref:ABC transporter permease n=1 Tax=unclassified Agrococcus TaxID=2615065 RepID=UPI00361AB574
MGDRHPVGTGRGAGHTLGTALGLAPFALLVLGFLAVPTAIAVASAFVGEDGLTLDAIAAIGSPSVLASLWASIWISALTAVIGAVVGALVCLALLGMPPTHLLRRIVDAASGTLAQFGGVMLAFAFIATIGIQGLVTVWMRDALGIDIYEGGVWLYQVPGLILPYLYFQIPLMVITFMPAVDGLRTQWAEANASLGGTRAAYWLHVGGPVLAPAFLGSLVLLFANSFSSFATAAALISQGGQIVTLQIRGALVSETVLGQEGLAGALALAMIVIMTVLMWGYSLLQRRTERWQR